MRNQGDGLGHRRRARVISVALLVAVGIASAAPALAASNLEVVALSSRPDTVSGGDVLVRIGVPPGAKLADVKVALNGKTVTGQLRPDPESHTLVGLVSGLRLGNNRLEASAKGASTHKLNLVNHPLTGPIFSGPQEQPFFCQTHQFTVYPTGPTLSGAQIQDPCMVSTRVDYLYRTTSNTFRPLPAGPQPADLAKTITNVPYIVRLETGTINRAIYQIAILDDPAVPGPDPGWNGRLVYTFGGGCSGGQYRQGSTTGGVLEDRMLTRGFAVASATLNVLGNNCNHVTSAETLMMVKERFIEAYGPPRYTIGWGCSGGAVQQYMIVDSYPGLLDGIVPQCSFPDLFQPVVADARLLLNYFLNGAGVPWAEDEIRLASGFGTFGQLPAQGRNNALRMEALPNRPGWPSAAWNAIVPTDVRYDPALHPDGIRPTFYDHNANIFGRDDRGFARRPLDNVGIQYGLAALNAGMITKEQFLDLNERIGGFDIDLNFISARTTADRKATRAAYESGSVLSGGGGLASVPILDVDVIYSDLAPGGDVHSKFHHFSTRERLKNANGHADNMVMWSGVFGPRSDVGLSAALEAMDAWLARIAADHSSDAPSVKIVRNKPDELRDGCWIGGAPPAFVPERQFLGGPGTSRCNDLYPGFSFPRHVAGESLAHDIVKCRVRAVDPADYAVAFTSDDIARLRRIFPDGVCDYSRAGIEQRDLETWLTYTGIGTYR